MIIRFVLVCFLAVSLSSCATEEENKALAAGIAIGTILGSQAQKGDNTQADEHKIGNDNHEFEQNSDEHGEAQSEHMANEHGSSKKHDHDEEKDDD